MKNEVEKQYSLYVFIGIYSIFILTFIFTQQLRFGIFGEELGRLNYLSIFILLAIIINNVRIFDIKFLWLWYITCIIIFCTFPFYVRGINEVITIMFSSILPLLFIGLKVDKETFRKLFESFIKILNVIIIFITIMGIFDFLLDYRIILGLNDILPDKIEELVLKEQHAGLFRLYSIHGHPLVNVELYLIYFLISIVASRYYNIQVNKVILIIVTSIGIAMTASKVGFVLLFISLLLVNDSKHRIKHYIIVSLLIVLTIFSGVFNATIGRLVNGSLTTGRSESWELVQTLNIYPIKFFTGYGNGFTFEYNEVLNRASAAFEYPFRMLALELGILTMILIYLCIFVYPIFLFIKRKHYFLMLSYLLVFIDVNTYNGIALKGDYMLIFCIFIFLLLNVSHHNVRKDHIQGQRED